MGWGLPDDELDRLAAAEPWQLSDTELSDAIPALSALIHRLEGLRATLLGEVAARPGVVRERGYANEVAWLVDSAPVSNAAARRMFRLGEALVAHPEVAAAYRAGEFCAEHAWLIIDFFNRPPKAMPDDAIPDTRKLLFDAAAVSDTRVLREQVARLRRVFEADDVPAGEDTDRNEFYASTTFGGRIAIKGDMDAETGEMLLAALSPLSTPRPAPDGARDLRTAAQRRADAFTEILRRYHDSAAGPTEGGERPHLFVHVDATDLVDAHNGRGTYAELFADTGVGWMPWMGPLTIQAVRRLACDCTLSPIVLDENGSPVDLGRSTRVISKKLRRALVARDHGCAFPACGRPASWCDGHHVKHWAEGGPTDLDNLVLLCRFHHRLIHHSDWDVIIGNDRLPWFVPPAKIDPRRQPVPAHTRGSPKVA